MSRNKAGKQGNVTVEETRRVYTRKGRRADRDIEEGIEQFEMFRGGREVQLFVRGGNMDRASYDC